MAEHDRTWSLLAKMARTNYPDDPNSMELAARAAFQEEEIVVYSRHDEAEKVEAAHEAIFEESNLLFTESLLHQACSTSMRVGGPWHNCPRPWTSMSSSSAALPSTSPTSKMMTMHRTSMGSATTMASTSTTLWVRRPWI
jgi:hypothetical protein